MPEETKNPMQELMDRKIWFLWIWSKDKNGNPTKKPIAANGGATGTDDAHSGTWVTYDEAVTAMRERGSAGVGFKIPKGYFFLDIDHKELNDPFVQMMLKRFNSYTEYSQSGNGIHIYGKVDIASIPTYIDDKGKEKLDRQFYMKNPHNDTEQYFGGLTNRFACYTGNVILDTALNDCTQAVLTTLDKDMRRKQKKKYSAKRDGDEDVYRIIEALHKQKNGEKFAMLFDDGDISGYGNDDSAADCALCSLIAFRTGDDPELIDAIFRLSALMREKWNRDDYRELTINAALEACHGVFHRSVMPAPEFIKFNRSGIAAVSVPLLAKYVREHLQYLIVRDNTNGGTIIYVYENGCYRLCGKDNFKGIIKGYITDYDEELLRMADVAACIEHLTTDLNTLTNDDLNADEDLINVANGLLRLSDLTLLPHSLEVFSTIQIPCEWYGTPSATPTFDGYMSTLTNHDKAVENLLLEFIGAVFSNVKGWRMKKSLFLYGKGDTGKSQLKSLVELMLGKGYFIGIDLAEIEARFGTANLYGKRLAGSSDMSFVTVSELKTFKKCTGGDSLFAEFKGQNAFEFIYNGLLWFCMNRLPKFGGDDGEWVYNRIMQVECLNVIPPKQQDKHLLEKMYAEREGIFYKAVMAFRNVIGNGYRFTEPDSIAQARQNYRNTNSTIISFFEECMAERSDSKISDTWTTGRIFKAYRAWCKDNNNGYAKTAREFRDELADHLGTTFQAMVVRRGTGGTFYRDYTLSEDAVEQFRGCGYDDFLV